MMIKISNLTRRQTEVYLGLAVGHNCATIASKLGLSVKTIDSHRASVLQVLRLRNNVDIARHALAHGYVGLSSDQNPVPLPDILSNPDMERIVHFFRKKGFNVVGFGDRNNPFLICEVENFLYGVAELRRAIRAVGAEIGVSDLTFQTLCQIDHHDQTVCNLRITGKDLLRLPIFTRP